MNDRGGKAQNLERLVQAGYPVPAFGVVGASWMAEHVRQIGSPGPQCIRATPLSADCVAAIESAIPPGDRFAVRSSALVEDGAQDSFAGQFRTELDVSREAIHVAVKAVWASAFEPAALAYARARGVSLSDLRVGVVIQVMVDADAAGVAFAIDPVTGDRRTSVVSAVAGLGEALVGGELDGDTYRVDTAGEVSTSVAQGERVLSDDQARTIASCARELSTLLGRWQDIEWALTQGRLHLLQSRPITNLDCTPDARGAKVLWDNSNIVESYAGVTTPLTFSFVRNVYTHVYRQFCAFMGVEQSLIEQNAQVFEMLGLFRGRIYYNLLNWYRVLSLLPGYAINASFMEQMMGVNDGFVIPPPPVPATGNRWVRFARSLTGMVRAWRSLEREVAAFHELVDDELNSLAAISLESLSPDELVGRFERIETRLVENWRAPLVNDFFAMVLFGALRKAIAAWCPDLPVEFQNDLLAAEQSIVSTEPIERLTRLAGRCTDLEANSPADLHSPQALLDALTHEPNLFAEFEALREKFGARTLEELKLETVTAKQEPLLLATQLFAYIKQCPSVLDTNDRRHAAERAFSDAFDSRLKRRVAFWLLDRTRHLVAGRENLRFERTRVFDAARSIFLEIGRQLALDGVLASSRDVFWLTKEELFGYIRGMAVDAHLHDIAQRRRAEWAEFDRHAPADRFETAGLPYHGNCFDEETPMDDATARGELAGTGCSPGVVTGEVVVVTDPNQCMALGDALLDGRILVAEHTDPGWTPLFPLARGILVQRGSLLSHSAIVARELGIPAIVSIPGLTQRLETGDVVTFDGSAGTIVLHEAAA
ncbi:MAG: PEP/pyruvate-binding domain-containing protein [Pseudomonadales bacterium]